MADSGIPPVPEGFEPEEVAAPQQQAEPMAASEPPPPPGFEPENEAPEESRTEQLKAGLEGAAKGVLGPLAPLAENKLFDVTKRSMREREANYPITSGVGQALGLGASLFTGVGEGALAAKAGEAVAGGLGLSKGMGAGAKIASEAVNQATQMALIQGSDEVSKKILNDPNSSAESAIANVGLGAALGGVTGAAIGSLSPLWKAASATKVGKVLSEFKDEVNFLHNNPDPVGQATKELTNLHEGTQALKESLFRNGIKGDLVKEFLPEVNEANNKAINGQLQTISDKLSKTVEDMRGNMKASSQAKNIEQDLINFQEKVTHPDADYLAKRNAIDDLRKDLHEYTNWNKQGTVEGSQLSQYAQKLNKDIIPMLEDSNIWGKAGEVQKNFNEAFHTFSNSKAEKDFMKTFTAKVGDDVVLNPAKVNTFVNQAGKPQAEIKNTILENYLKERQAFADKLNGQMISLGKDPIVENPSVNMLQKLMQDPTTGSELANKFMNKLGDTVLGKAAATSIGGGIGGAVGHPMWGALIGEHVLGGPMTSVMGGLTKSIMGSNVKATGLKSAVDYGMAVAKNEKTLSDAASAIFKSGARVLADKNIPDAKDRDKLDKTIDYYHNNQEKVQDINNGDLGHYLPGHQVALTAATVQSAAYLAQLKPRAYQSSPLDTPIEPTSAQIQRYHDALDIAHSPAIVLQKVKDGTLQASDVQDLTHMFPNLYNNMKTKVVDELHTAVARKEVIPYKTRVSMSLFLGQPLDTSMTPSSIQAAQPQQAQGPSGQQQQSKPMKNRKGTNSLGKSNSSYQTQSQSAESDRNNRE